MMQKTLPVIDVAPLFGRDAPARRKVADAIGAACRNNGFFYARGTGVDAARLDALAREFFALPEDEKMRIAMAKGGRAWRGFFPVGGELTSGKPDRKEGIYFGSELAADDPRVRTGVPMHGANQWPVRPAGLRDAVLDYLAANTRAAHAIMEGIALSLGLDAQYFRQHYTGDPTILFRIFHYPPDVAGSEQWGVGEHTDYGLLTLLAQDDAGGLQVKSPDGWIEAPPIPDTLVCNIGDMLDRLTGGLYRSTPHRAKNTSRRGRLSFPFFFDPGWEAEIVPLPARAVAQDDRETRWDRESVHDFRGTYGNYLLGKVGKVFPDLKRDVIS
ncbi:MAG: isopenicillin N synthase family oxygenase [Alphaproteobacteria bacterium]|nr:isopenicillin N synthase family oxygenase [Alphaproteobacteria bacterium]MBL6937267.1 isopenicillin N synthase family oxygenase [Alphaproteobacteria bacterium]MBL7096171.1 isopenicillin N synthase family oxygenase [Alphaproteobacteria bacterium]